MMSIRQLTRSLPRISSQISTPASRRTLIGLTRPSQLSKVWKAAPVYRAAFSTALPRFEQSGSIDHELAAKLESELQLEAEATPQGEAAEELPAHLKSYLDTNPWNLIDNAGSEEVILTRRFGKENIKVVFSIADINEFEHDPDSFGEDPALYDEEASDLQQGGAQSKGTSTQGRTRDGNFNVAPQDDSPPAARDELADDESADAPPEGFPARVQVTITKDGNQGALYIESIVRDGEIMTESLNYFANADLAEAKTADQDHARRTLYTGPPFGNLDEDLQALIDQYTAERGVDTALALFIPEYMDYKEQKEYVGWLQATKAFVES